jgi:hypothetical protein
MKIHDNYENYDLHNIFEMLKMCLRTNDMGYWAEVANAHKLEIGITCVEDFRSSLIKHVYDGECVLHRGAGCESVVKSGRWAHLLGVRLIDITLEWVDRGALSVTDFIRIGDALGMNVNAKKKVRSLRTSLIDRRRTFLNIVDSSKLHLAGLFTQLGGTSNVKTLRSIGSAHGLHVLDEDTRDEASSKIINHVAQGKCAENMSSAPGCEVLIKDPTVTREDAVHLQVAVLRYVVESASKKQLQKVLDLYDISYGPGEKFKGLRRRLKKYLQNIERGKLKEKKDEYDAIERLQKLNEIRENWPKLVPMNTKEQIIRNFREATSSAALSSFTCACCARKLPIADRVRKLHTEIDLDLLESPSFHWNDESFAPPPTPFETGPLRNKILEEDGVSEEGGNITLELCNYCSRGLRERRLPKHALANRLYSGPVPNELKDLTMIEESMIARARSKSWIVKLQEQESDSVSPTAQRGLRGHTIIYPQSPDQLTNVLPPSIEDTLSYVCVIFVGSSKLTPEWLKEKAKPLAVRKAKVRAALEWLKYNNPLYKNVEISSDNLAALPTNDVLPYNIERIDVNEAQRTVTSGYDPTVMDTDLDESQVPSTHFESVVIADVDAHTPPKELRAAAVRHAKMKGKPFVQVGHSTSPVNEFFNVDLFPSLYPTLYPYGCGGFEDRSRSKIISMKEHTKWLFTLRDQRWKRHHSFLFSVFNILQRRALLLGSSLKVKRAAFNQFAQNFASVSSTAVEKVLVRIENGNGVTAKTEEERKVLRLMKEVNLVTAKVPGSSASRVAMRNEIRALTMTHGMPSFYITVNPADAHNPIVKFLAGENIDIDRMLEDEIPKYWEQSCLISSNPAVGAEFFNLYLKAFIRTILGCEETVPNRNEGLLGVVKAHYGCVEAQGRGSLHCHMLVWIDGALNPNEIREKVINDKEWGKRLLDYLDDTISNVVPEDPAPSVGAAHGDKDPCTLRGVPLDTADVDDRLILRIKDVGRLAERVQRHRHSNTCYKYFKAGDRRVCRFDLKEENFRSESNFDPETGLINLRCLDGLVNNFNMTMLEAVRCNMDIQFIGSGDAAKAMIYYITDYITKSQLKSHVAYAALQQAVKKCEDVAHEDDDCTVRSKRLLQKSAYALVSHQEMSAQQVASYLMGYEDHFTSHEFGCLYWASFERFVERGESEKLCTTRVFVSDESDGENDEVMANPVEEDEDQTGSDEAGPEDDKEEEVSIRVDEMGRVTALGDQVLDYTLRPKELEDMCLWDYVAEAEKVNTRKGNKDLGRTDDDSRNEYEPTCDDEDEVIGDDSFEEVGTRNGTKLIERYPFLPDHRESSRKHVRMRKQRVIPVPIGPALPRRNEDANARYCRLMLIIFKPWRTASGLRGLSESWEFAFEEFGKEMKMGHKHVVENMEVLHECRDSRNEHMQTRIRNKTRSNAGNEVEGGSAGNDIEDIDMADVLEHLEDIDRMSSKRQSEARSETEKCLEKLERCDFFRTIERMERSETCPVERDPLQFDDVNLEDSWRDTYEKRKERWKKMARDNNDDEGINTTSLNSARMMDRMDLDAAPVVNSGMDAQDGVMHDQGDVLVGVTAEKWSLNREQKRAFAIVARHVMVEKPDQLLMHLGGPGGTGKSRVVSALRDFFERRDEKRRFRLAAYTGVAARNIGGATLHAILQLNESGRREMSTKTKNDLSAMWEGVDYLFVDEVSMIGCEMLHNISRALTEAKGKTSVFGGVSVIMAGDFAQLPPIGDTRLYKDVNTTSLTAASTNRAQGKILGRLLWLSFETVVFLQETMRQNGCENVEFVDLLQRLRNGACTKEDFDVLKGRVLQRNMLADKGKNDDFTPVIVTNNATRDAINCRAAEAFAKQAGSVLHWYHAIDTHKKSRVTDTALIEKLEEQHSGQTKHRLRRIPLVIGMPVAINQNFDVAAGVVNGSHGILRDIRYFEDEDGQRFLKSCVVEIPDSEAVDMPHLPKHHFPILPDTTDLKFEHNGSHRRCTIKRRQVPIEPGFAMTVHKAQGKTLGNVIIDLAGCSGTEPPYVMASRATSLGALMVLRDFEHKQLTKRHSEDLRKEFLRLSVLKWRTVEKYGELGELEEARGMLLGMKVKSSTKGKRSINEVADEEEKGMNKKSCR